jgi:hypothetical protein
MDHLDTTQYNVVHMKHWGYFTHTGNISHYVHGLKISTRTTVDQQALVADPLIIFTQASDECGLLCEHNHLDLLLACKGESQCLRANDCYKASRAHLLLSLLAPTQ